MSIRKILLPTDLSEESRRAFAPAAALALQLGASLVLLHVVENVGCTPSSAPAAPTYLPGTSEELERARSVLAEAARSLPGVPVETDVLVGPEVVHAIADYASERGFDLIVLSSHGRTGFRRLVTGSVTASLLRAARIPVLVVPRPPEPT